jgi:hypothetical protein
LDDTNRNGDLMNKSSREAEVFMMLQEVDRNQTKGQSQQMNIIRTLPSKVCFRRVDAALE